jgi:uncharacterized protein involved in exopolysaccharide biosynthesis
VRYAQDAAEVAAIPQTAQAEAASKLWDLLDLAHRRRGLILACSVSVTALALLYVVVQTPVYRATSELLIDPQALQVVGRDIVRADTAASIDFANVDSQALVIVSTPVLREVVEKLQLTDDPAFIQKPGFLSRLTKAQVPRQQQIDQIIEALRRDIVVHRVDATLVFQIVVSQPNAEQAARIANQIAVSYLQRGSDVRSGSVSRANASLISQISGLRSQLSEAETAVELFRSQNGLISTGSAGLVVTQQLKDLYTQIGIVNSELARQAARKEEAAKYGADSALADTLPEALSSPMILALRTQYAQTAQTAASLAQTLMPQHPRLLEIKAELTETRKLLDAEIGRIRISIRKAYDQAAANLAKLQTRANELTKTQVTSSSAEIKLRQLESEAEAIRSVYNASLARAKELEQQQKIETSNSRLLSEAVAPLKPSKPPALLVLPAAAMFGTIAGLALAYLLDLLPGLRRPSPQTPPDVSGRLETTPIIRLPHLAAAWRRSTTELNQAAEETARRFVPIAESLQKRFSKRLPAVVGFASPLGLKSMQSALQGLAQALAERGEAVLICDGPPEKPDMKVRRIAPKTPSPAAASHRPAIDRAQRWQNAGFKRTYTGRQPTPESLDNEALTPPNIGQEFLLFPMERKSSAPTTEYFVDAIIVIVDPSQTTKRQLTAFLHEIDPAGDRIIAIAELETETRLSTMALNLRRKAFA